VELAPPGDDLHRQRPWRAGHLLDDPQGAGHAADEVGGLGIAAAVPHPYQDAVPGGGWEPPGRPEPPFSM
jgi:hypothetical protein